MNRSFLIVLIPAVAVGLGYIFVFRLLGLRVEPFHFIGAGIVTLAAVILVHRYQRKKAARRIR